MNDTMTHENLVWTTPSRDSSGSMPLGNGDIGLNVWVEENGDLLFYVSKTDAWDENAQLLKLGRIRVALSPNPFVTGAMFRQELDLANGCIRIVAGVDATPSSRSGAEASGGGAASTVDATPPSRSASGEGAASTGCVDARPPSRGAIPDLAWTRVQPDAAGFINLHDLFAGQDGLVYLANRFEAPFAGRWRLSLGHDGGARVFVDGVPVLCAPETRNPAKPDRSTVELALTAGVHEIVIAFDLASGNGWGVFCEWQVPDGEQADRVQRVYPRNKQ